MAQDTKHLVVGVDRFECAGFQDLVEIWEPSGVPPQRCAAEEHLEMLPVHTKPAGYAPEYWVCFQLKPEFIVIQQNTFPWQNEYVKL